MKTVRAIGYVRVSTEEQARGGVSLDAQRDKIAAWANLTDAMLVDIVTDAGFSGSKMSRPGVAEVLRRVRAGEADCVVVYAIDRLSRSTLDFLSTVRGLAKDGIGFVSVREALDSSSPHGKFTMTILAAVAEMERDLIAARTVEGMSRCARERRVFGSTPYGWRREGSRLVEDVEQQRVLTYVQELRAGGASYRFIAEDLNGQFLTAKNGGRWLHSSVKSVLNTAKKMER